VSIHKKRRDVRTMGGVLGICSGHCDSATPKMTLCLAGDRCRVMIGPDFWTLDLVVKHQRCTPKIATNKQGSFHLVLTSIDPNPGHHVNQIDDSLKPRLLVHSASRISIRPQRIYTSTAPSWASQGMQASPFPLPCPITRELP
jgi:hypothetical protein